MWMGEKVKIKFAKILSDYMPVSIYIGNQSLHFLAFFSFYYNSIADLVQTLSSFLSIDGKYCVTFRDSPSEYEFAFQKDNDEGRLTIIHYPSHKRIDGTELITVTETPINIALPFWEAITDLESRAEMENYERHCHYPFPYNEVKRLNEQIAKMV
jgi:hypothetical protein